LQLVNDILDLSKVEAGKMEFWPEALDVERIVGEVVTMLRGIAQSQQLRVVMEVDPSVEDIVLDPARLKQVLYNYLSNALKFTDKGGGVTVRVQPETAASFRLEVEDTGPGIRAEDMGRLFVEFQQLDAGLTKKHAGTGLGLSLTKRIVEAQGGSVGVHSVVGRGSIFYAVLPRRHGSPSLTPASAAPPPPGACAPSVLVIENDDDHRTLLAGALRRAGYTVELATTGSEGLTKFRSAVFDAVTLNLLLPDMSGLDVIYEMRQHPVGGEVPVVIVTAVTGESELIGLTVRDVLRKPIDAVSVLSSLVRAGVVSKRPGDVLIVVDDDERTLKLLEVTLTGLGYTVHPKLDGVSALRAAATVRASAVILDLLMPDMNGFEFLECFRRQAQNRDVPVIVWTAKDLTAAERERLREHAAAVHSKARGGMAGVVRELEHVLRPIAVAQADR
jgi:CheY-like chemotaxis protein